MDNKRNYTNEELTAYLDGETEFVSFEDLKKDLQNDEALRNRLSQLKYDQVHLQSAMDTLLTSAPQMPELDSAARQPGQLRTGLYPALTGLAAGIMLMVSGVFIGQNWNSDSNRDWKDYVAAYHYLYVRDTLANVELSTHQMVSQLDVVETTLGKELSLDAIQSIESLTYKRSQILGFEGAPIAQITFLSETGIPIAFCVTKGEDGAKEGVAILELEGMAAATWVKNGYNFLLIGGSDQTLIHNAASQLSTRI